MMLSVRTYTRWFIKYEHWSLSPYMAHSLNPRPPPPHSILFRVHICSFPPFESTPLSPDWQNFWTPLSWAFSCLGDPPKSKTLLNVPLIFLFYNPLFKFLWHPKRERKKNHPLFKEISGWKVKYLPFLFFLFTILGPDFVAQKVPLYRRFWEHACGPSDPGVGGGGPKSQ